MKFKRNLISTCILALMLAISIAVPASASVSGNAAGNAGAHSVSFQIRGETVTLAGHVTGKVVLLSQSVHGNVATDTYKLILIDPHQQHAGSAPQYTPTCKIYENTQFFNRYPGSLEGWAVIVSCTPGLTFCTAKAQLQNKVAIHGGGQWGDIGRAGPTEDGCPSHHASVEVVGCSRYNGYVAYRTLGLFTLTDAAGIEAYLVPSTPISSYSRLCD
jgi:hypothetical protein